MTTPFPGLDAAAPVIADRYRGMVRSAFARMVARMGPALRGVRNDWDYARIFRETVYPCCVQEGGVYTIVDAMLDRTANAYAKAAIDACRDKLLAKVGRLENVTVARVAGASFRIFGTRDGKTIEVEQNVILNFSKLGKPFNQFPARIKVDGRPIGEKTYKAAFAD